MIGLIGQQIPAMGQLHPRASCVVVNAAVQFLECTAKKEGDVLGIDPLGRAGLRDTIPVLLLEQIQIALSVDNPHQHPVFRVHAG